MGQNLHQTELESEILILSSFLHGNPHPDSKAEPRDTKNTSLTFASHLATLLTVNPDTPDSCNVNAVIGNVERLSVTCVVCSDDYRPTLEPGSGPRGPTSFQLIPLDPNSDKGKLLLHEWSTGGW